MSTPVSFVASQCCFFATTSTQLHRQVILHLANIPSQALLMVHWLITKIQKLLSTEYLRDHYGKQQRRRQRRQQRRPTTNDDDEQ